MKLLRGAVIGCGMIAEFHLRGWTRLPGVEIVALADPDPRAAERCRHTHAPAARLYSNLAALLAVETLDFVDILTPPAHHRAHCLLARAAGLHVSCQKPLCDTLADAHRLVADFASSGKLFCVHENHVYRPWFRQVRALQAEGALGALELVRLVQHDPDAPPQSFSRQSGRGVLLEYGVHLADMIRHLLGLPLRVRARLQSQQPEIRGENLAEVVFEYAGAEAIIDIGWKSDRHGPDGALFRGNRGLARLEGTMTRGQTSRFRVTVGATDRVDEARDTLADYVESFHAFEGDFIHALRHGGTGPQPAAENVRSLEMVFAAYAAAEQGAPVDFAAFVAAQPHSTNPSA